MDETHTPTESTPVEYHGVSAVTDEADHGLQEYNGSSAADDSWKQYTGDSSTADDAEDKGDSAATDDADHGLQENNGDSAVADEADHGLQEDNCDSATAGDAEDNGDSAAVGDADHGLQEDNCDSAADHGLQEDNCDSAADHGLQEDNCYSAAADDVDHGLEQYNGDSTAADDADQGWQEVTYAKRRKNKTNNNGNTSASVLPATNSDWTLAVSDNAFSLLERQSSELPRDDGDVNRTADNGKAEESKKKNKKTKKPKKSKVEVAGEVDGADEAAFLPHTSTSCEKQRDTQMRRSVNSRFGRGGCLTFMILGLATASVFLSQITWILENLRSPV